MRGASLIVALTAWKRLSLPNQSRLKDCTPDPARLIRAKLRLREASSLYYGWAKQAKQIRARHTN